jgi:hypothetical protein
VCYPIKKHAEPAYGKKQSKAKKTDRINIDRIDTDKINIDTGNSRGKILLWDD